jgi:hypothetical protein
MQLNQLFENRQHGASIAIESCAPEYIVDKN